MILDTVMLRVAVAVGNFALHPADLGTVFEMLQGHWREQGDIGLGFRHGDLPIPV